ncbi:hypothetical protein CR513_15915, partial [Mucuna pruriens]
MSLLSLLVNSKGHRNLLLKILNEAHMAQDITVERFGGIVNNLTVGSHLSFSEEEILVEGRRHNQPLQISVKCSDYTIVRVLIDNGSSLNVLPKTTLDKLCSANAQLRANSVTVERLTGPKERSWVKLSSLFASVLPRNGYPTRIQWPLGQTLNSLRRSRAFLPSVEGEIRRKTIAD